ncbi:MAG: pseudouridine-5'-phosphate glycosidase [Candidatus Puniceispirillum sp.]|jgi:pseudouridylate synthase|nr:pseudouridine-5'-phosphate glycosidase [Candidatus Puniceispirillum sp.]
MIDYTDEVADARATNKPIVALESTIISHGLPWPDNLETAKRLEAEVRAVGAVPATIAVLDGIVKIGLNESDLERLATPDSDIQKLSRRDLPHILAQKGHGATTVAATMIMAQKAGIKVFATGGIGGVHRGAQQTFDISADLQELAKSDVAVVCAGPKAILDLSLTLEYLETLGVPVIGYQTDELPAFWSRSSGLKLTSRAETPEEIAAMLSAKWSFGLAGGAVIMNPVPEDDAIAETDISAAIDAALAAADKQAISGKELTPFLLQHMVALTGGDSLKTNIALVLNNARLAANIAVAMAAS